MLYLLLKLGYLLRLKSLKFLWLMLTTKKIGLVFISLNVISVTQNSVSRYIGFFGVAIFCSSFLYCVVYSFFLSNSIYGINSIM